MKRSNTTIPWSSQEEWQRLLGTLDGVFAAGSRRRATLLELARKIYGYYQQLDPLMELGCGLSCPGCDDICCRKATVWYDLKDVLTLYGCGLPLPERQIYRENGLGCCNLRPTGCQLPRTRRPFVCTWYICPLQKEAFESLEPGLTGKNILPVIDCIKEARRELAQLYSETDP